jgi:hypothetical protein
MRRAKRAISLEEAKNLLRTNRRGVLAVNGDSGYPFALPINFYYDEDENRIYFHSAKSGHKIDSIVNNSKVCFTTFDDGYLEEGDWAYYVSSCVVYGQAVLIDDLSVVEAKVRTLALKYFPTPEEVEEELSKYLPAVQLIAIDIEHISGKKIHER